MGTLCFTACDDDDDDNHGFLPDAVVVNTFEAQYPGAKHVKWEYENGYNVADFHNGGYATHAWYDMQGHWIFTETELPFQALPALVQTNFQTSQYATWKIDGIDKIERLETGVIYIIEAEMGEAEIDLHYAENGSLIKEVPNGQNNYFPTTVPNILSETIQKMYPGAVILEIESKIGYEVDILHQNIVKEVWFDAQNQWIYTEWDILLPQVPAIVINALKASAYASYHIDDINFVEKPAGIFYEFELEQGNREVTILISEKGEIVTPQI